MKSENEFYEKKGVYGISPDSANIVFQRTQKTALKRLARSLQIIQAQKPKKILDIGCGDGFFALQIIKTTKAEVSGIDISKEAVEVARNNGINALNCDLNQDNICFETNSFDLVYLGEVLEHMLDPDCVLDEIYRILKPDGYLLLSTPNLAAWYNRFLLLFGIQPIFTETSTRKNFGRVLKFLGEGSQPVGHLRIFTLGALKKIIKSCNFEIVHIEAMPFLPFPLIYQVDKLIGKIPSLGSDLLLLAQKRNKTA
jgi:methionine biosynthesis protein MetW